MSCRRDMDLFCAEAASSAQKQHRLRRLPDGHSQVRGAIQHRGLEAGACWTGGDLGAVVSRPSYRRCVDDEP